MRRNELQRLDVIETSVQGCRVFRIACILEPASNFLGRRPLLQPFGFEDKVKTPNRLPGTVELQRTLQSFRPCGL